MDICQDRGNGVGLWLFCRVELTRLGGAEAGDVDDVARWTGVIVVRGRR